MPEISMYHYVKKKGFGSSTDMEFNMTQYGHYHTVPTSLVPRSLLTSTVESDAGGQFGHY